VLVFFVLMLISLFAISVGYTVRQKLQVISRIEARQKLRLLGEAGVKKSIYVVLKHRLAGLPVDTLYQTWSNNESDFRAVEVGEGQFSVFYTVEVPQRPTGEMKKEDRYGLIDEERKINLNTVKKPGTLQRLFEACGITREEGKVLADSLFDWRDADDDSALSGAESRYYRGRNPFYLPRNHKFASLQELRWVRGVSGEVYEKILPHVTLDSSGEVNLNTAPREVLFAAGIEAPVCDKIVMYRAGRDLIEGTDDDLIFEDLSSAPQVLANRQYLDDNEQRNFKSIVESGTLTLRSRNFSAHVLSKLKYGRQGLRTVAVFGEKGVLKRWEEEFVILSS